jgi:2-keto-3-deoxy-L-rhamnonate aldolase RhmA
VADVQQELNEQLCLMAQIETSAGVANAEAICAVPGVDIFLGPADLSASLGVPGQTGHEKVYDASAQVIRTARKYGKHIAVGAAPQDFSFWVEQDVDLMFCTNDIAAMKVGADDALQQARRVMERAGTRRA